MMIMMVVMKRKEIQCSFCPITFAFCYFYYLHTSYAGIVFDVVSLCARNVEDD